MASLLELTERLTPAAKLVPFFTLVAVYFAASDGREPSAWAVLVKCAPVLWLAAFVAAVGRGPRAQYGRRVLGALLCSAVGDALLLWEPLFPAGMVAFAAAHVSYLRALGFSPPRPWAALVPFAGAAAALCHLRPPALLSPAVAAYTMLLATVCWRALAGLPRGRAAALGAVSFLVSDAVLGADMFHSRVPHARALVMSTYYLAQLGFALSVLDAPPRAPTA